MAQVSRFVNPKLQPAMEKFASEAEKKSITSAAETLRTYAAGINAQEITNGLIHNQGVSQEDADFFMHECGRIVNEKLKSVDSLTINDKKNALRITHETDISSAIKKDICMDLAKEAIATKNEQMLRLSCMETGGISFYDFESIAENVERAFNPELSDRIQMVMQVKENPQLAITNLAGKMENGTMTAAQYIQTMAQLEKDLPKEHTDAGSLQIETAESADGFEIRVGMEFMENAALETVKISDRECSSMEDGLSIKKEDAVSLVQRYGILGDNVMDCIAEANFPPEDPNFVSVMDQKFSNFISAKSIPPAAASKEESKLSSVLPDEIKSAFLAVRNDMQYEHIEEIHEDNTEAYEKNYDGNQNGIPDAEEGMGFDVDRVEYSEDEEDMELD